MFFRILNLFLYDEPSDRLDMMESIPTKRGVFYLTGVYNNVPTVFCVERSDNLKDDINNKISEIRNLLGSKYVCDFSSIVFCSISDKKDVSRTYLKLIKQFNPMLNYKTQVESSINSINNDFSYDIMPSDKVDIFLKGKLGDVERFREFYPKGNLKPFTFDNLSELENKTGVYFIYDNSYELIYVGQSINLSNRLSVHASANSHFSTFEIVEVEPQMLNECEYYFINKLKPRLNIKETHTYCSSKAALDLQGNKALKSYFKIKEEERTLKVKFAAEEINKELEELRKYIFGYEVI